MEKQKKIRPLLFVLFVLFTNNGAQQITGERGAIKELIMKSNNITTLVTNYGSITAPNRYGNIADLAWNKLGYMFEFGPLVAAEVTSENGEKLHIVDDSFLKPGQGDYNPDGTVKWGWLPRSGFANPDFPEIANSLNKQSWPNTWSSWPGEFGEGVIIAENELFYVVDDFSNAEFPYYPFPEDSTKRGLGVSLEVRVYQFGGFLKDALIIRYKLTNESTKDLSKVYFGFQGDPHIGGPSDYSDDVAGFLTENYPVKAAANTIYVYDKNGIGNAGLTTGYLGFKLLRTPDSLGLTSLHVEHYTNTYPNVPKNDILMWQWLSADKIDTAQALLNTPTDNIINFGTGPFELKSGESKFVDLAIFLSYDFNDMVSDAAAMQYYVNWPYLDNNCAAAEGDEDYKIELTEPASVNEGDIKINWNYSGNAKRAKVFIDYSANGGKDWKVLSAECDANNFEYTWNSKTVEDGTQYMLRVLAYNPDNPREFYYDNCNAPFTINNPDKNAKPELQFFNFPDTIKLSKTKIEWNSNDADNSELSITIGHSTNPDGPFEEIFTSTYINGNNSFYWDLSSIPNFPTNYLQFICKDNENEVAFISKPFTIDVKRAFYDSSIVKHVTGSASAIINVVIADTAQLKYDDYEITFNIDNDVKQYSVKNITTEETLIDNSEIIEEMSSPTFEGIRLNIINFEPKIDYEKTHFNRSELESIYNVYFSSSNSDYIGSPHVKSELDWMVVFNDLDTNSDGSWKNVAETSLFAPSMKQGNCPFKIINLDSNEKANYIIDETQNVKLQNERWDEGEKIILRPQNATGATVSYALSFDFSSGKKPKSGDTLWIITYNPLSNEDVYRFKLTDNFILSTKETASVLPKYNLYQNYPNPFNPSTIIEYYIPKSGPVKLSVFDMLGRKVAVLVNEEQASGKYKINFNASNLSSGIYFYKLQSGNFSKIKKMILLR